jgi:hypothetical protein
MAAIEHIGRDSTASVWGAVLSMSLGVATLIA